MVDRWERNPWSAEEDPLAWSSVEEYMNWFDGLAERVAKAKGVENWEARQLIRENSRANMASMLEYVATVEREARPAGPATRQARSQWWKRLFGR